MEEILYLVHTTDKPDCILWDELKISPFNVTDQFPGVYFSIITKINIDNERLYPGKYIMIFSKKLLLQKNYHINFRDYNGILNESNTYYPWNLPSFINECKNHANKKKENEIIFHDNVSAKYLYKIIEKSKDILPREEIYTETEPNMNLIPFYCYPFDDIYNGLNPIYSGIDPLDRSSIQWYKMILRMCNIEFDANDTIDGMLQKAREHAKDLYNNRLNQDISVLEEYVHFEIVPSLGQIS